jgi:hypothetical protein
MSKGGGQSYGLPTFSIQNSDTSTKIPDWLTSASQTGVNAASNLLHNPGQAYTGELYPNMTQDQNAAGDLIRGSIGAYQPYFDAASDYTQAGTGAAPDIHAQTYKNGLQGISEYMNPYIGNVVNSVSALGQQNLQNALTQTADQAASRGAFGGSRHGVQEGVATAQNNLYTNNLLSQLLSQGYDKATSLLGSDITNNLNAQAANQANAQNTYGRNLTAGNQMSNIGTANRAANVADINNLLQFGSMQQNTQAAQDQAKYTEFQRQQMMPYMALQAYNQTVQGAPHDTNQHTTSTGFGMSPQQQQSSSPLMSALGLGMTGLSLFNPGVGGMSAMGNLAGWLGGGLLR